jgi:hypothetical protein
LLVAFLAKMYYNIKLSFVTIFKEVQRGKIASVDMMKCLVYHKQRIRRGTEVVITGSPGERLGGQKLPRGFESRPLRHNS